MQQLRTRDLVLFILIIQLLGHLVVHWDSYSCNSFGNIQASVWIVLLILRQSFKLTQTDYMSKIFTLFLTGVTVSLTCIAFNQECAQKSTYIFYCIIGYVLLLSTCIDFFPKQKQPRIPKIVDQSAL